MHRSISKAVATTLAVLAAFIIARADETEDKVANQKKAAMDHWKTVFQEENPPLEETAHMLVYGMVDPKELKDVGQALEKEFSLASKALKLDTKEGLWPGKLTVYLFGDRRQFITFVHEVARRKVDPDELGLFAIRGEMPFIAAGPAKTKQGPPEEFQVGEQLAAALLEMKAGSDVADWVTDGFGRATVWRSMASSPFVRNQRKQARDFMVRTRPNAKDVWTGNLTEEDGPVLRASLADFLAYGPGASKFPAFLEGFKAGEEGKKKPGTMEALTAAKISPDALNKGWQGWVVKGAF